MNDQIWPEIVIFGHFGPGLLGGCGARAVSRKTPIYLIGYKPKKHNLRDKVTKSRSKEEPRNWTNDSPSLPSHLELQP